MVVVLDVKLRPYFLLNFASEYLQNKEKDPHQILIKVRSMSDYSMVEIWARYNLLLPTFSNFQNNQSKSFRKFQIIGLGKKGKFVWK